MTFKKTPLCAAPGSRVALYFGCMGPQPGHYLRRPGDAVPIRPEGMPWTLEMLDAGLLRKRQPDEPDGRVHWVCGGFTRNPSDVWHAFFWWDRSGDSRPNSFSTFCVRGFAIDEDRAAFAFARETWPGIVARQAFPLVLCDLPGQGSTLLSPDELALLERVIAGASPEPWVNDKDYRIQNAAGECMWDGKHFEACGYGDMEFCAVAREWLPELVRRIKALEARRP